MLTKEQNDLFTFMSELCQKAQNKKWSYEWEYFLWRALQYNFKSIGKLKFNDDVRIKLNQLVTECNGWIRYKRGGKEFINLDRWKKEVKKSNIINFLVPFGSVVLLFIVLITYFHIKEHTYFFITIIRLTCNLS